MSNEANNKNTIERIYDLYMQIDTIEMYFLQNCGWHHTSNTPDSVWVWEKMFDGKMLQVDRKRALSIEGVSND